MLLPKEQIRDVTSVAFELFRAALADIVPPLMRQLDVQLLACMLMICLTALNNMVRPYQV